MSTTELSTSYNRSLVISNGDTLWKPFCSLIVDNTKIYISKYRDFDGQLSSRTRQTISEMRSSYKMIKILVGKSFFIVGLNSVFDENLNLLMVSDRWNIWIKYGCMISSPNEKAIVKYLKDDRRLNVIYVEDFDKIYYNPNIRFKTRQDKINTEIELTELCKKLLN